MEEKFSTHTNELEKLRTVIQSRPSVKFLVIEIADDTPKVIVINRWYHRGKNLWKLGFRYEGEIREKESLEEVLIHEGISKDDYVKIMQGMTKLNIEAVSVGEEYFCPGCIELETVNAGLRYYENSDTIFEPDDEYISVRKLSDNWHAYQRDWN